MASLSEVLEPSSWKGDMQPWIHSSVSSAPPLPAKPDHQDSENMPPILPATSVSMGPSDMVTLHQQPSFPAITLYFYSQITSTFYPDHFLPLECNVTPIPTSPPHLFAIISLDLVHWLWLGWTKVAYFIWNHGIWSQGTWMLAYLNFYFWFEMQTTMHLETLLCQQSNYFVV